MEKICTTCQQRFELSDWEKKFLSKISPRFGEKSFPIPEPKDCPHCRAQLRTSHRNEEHFYHHTSALSGKPLISLYAPETPAGRKYKIFSNEEWWSDKWDAMEAGRDFDFNKPFFEQFGALNLDVPRVNLIQVNNENSPYTTGTGFCKNCYLINSSENCENCYYGKLLQTCRDVVDSSYIYDSELIYQGFYLRNCYNCVYLSYSQNCVDCYFSENLKGCRNCFLCTNLQNKEFYFGNQALSKEAYHEKLASYLGSWQKFQEALGQYHNMRQERIHKYAVIVNCDNVTGDFLINSKDCFDCYDLNDSQDCRYVQVGVNVKDLLDCSNMYLKPELCYQTLGTIEIFNCHFCLYVFHSHDLMLSEFCCNSHNLFGCSGLRNKHYCIFNKQYTKEEYEAIVPRLIEHMQKTGEWGQYFPMSLSPYAYNETLAYEYYPLASDEIWRRGWNYFEGGAEMDNYLGPEIELSDRISDVPDSISGKILRCEVSGKPYKIIPQELSFYKKMKLPLPRTAPEIRHRERMKFRNERRLYDRNCMNCGLAVRATYAPERPERIFCEKCYLEEVY